jgi:hypothetical protein
MEGREIDIKYIEWDRGRVFRETGIRLNDTMAS